jgi:hypothetical protein
MPTLPPDSKLAANHGWMSPLNKIHWHTAVVQRKTSLTLPDGREFKLNYKHRLGKPREHAAKGFVLVTPVKGFHPRGWLNIDTVEDKGKWLGDF